MKVTLQVIVVAAHPHEAEFYSGGTLLRCVARGDTVSIICITNGNLSDPAVNSQELSEIRHKEATRAASLLDARLDWLDQSEHFVTVDAVTVMQVVEIFRELHPDIVLTHSPHSLTPDHNAVSEIAIQASYKAAVTNIEPSVPAISKPPIMFAMDGMPGQAPEPSCFVDISEYESIKHKALECYSSLLELYAGTSKDLWKSSQAIGHYRGLQAGVKCAEGFRAINNDQGLGTTRWLP